MKHSSTEGVYYNNYIGNTKSSTEGVYYNNYIGNTKICFKPLYKLTTIIYKEQKLIDYSIKLHLKISLYKTSINISNNIVNVTT
jgi:hypothetical protein